MNKAIIVVIVACIGFGGFLLSAQSDPLSAEAKMAKELESIEVQIQKGRRAFESALDTFAKSKTPEAFEALKKAEDYLRALDKLKADNEPKVEVRYTKNGLIDYSNPNADMSEEAQKKRVKSQFGIDVSGGNPFEKYGPKTEDRKDE